MPKPGERGKKPDINSPDLGLSSQQKHLLKSVFIRYTAHEAPPTTPV